MELSLFYIFVVLLTYLMQGGAWVAQWVRSLDLTTHTGLSPIRRGFAPGFVNYKKGCTRLAAASDQVNQLLAHGRWFSPGTPASSTTKTGRHDIAEILLKVALNTKNQIKSDAMKNKPCHRVRTVPSSNPKIVETEGKSLHLTLSVIITSWTNKNTRFVFTVDY